MEPEAIERIRSASFNLARRGYDRREVDLFLSQLADWLDGIQVDSGESEAVKAELERLAERTSGVLTAAGEAGNAIREDAQARASTMVEQARVEANAQRVEADGYSERIRGDADDYMQTTRGKADAYATEKRAEADAMAREAREDLDDDIADLTARRDKLLDELESIAGTLAGTASEHRGRREEPYPEETPQAPEPERHDETQTLEVKDDETVEVPTAERPSATAASQTGSA